MREEAIDGRRKSGWVDMEECLHHLMHSPKKVGFCVDNYVTYTHIDAVNVLRFGFLEP